MAFWKRKKKQPTRPYCAAVVPAAGNALRMGGGGKMLLTLAGLPVIAHTLLALNDCPAIDEIVVAARSEDIIPIGELCKNLGITKVRHIIRGGETRAHSVLLALMEISPQTQVAAVHDGARPCVTSDLCQAVIHKAAQTGAAVPGLYIVDTIKSLDEDGRIIGTIDRSLTAAVQTPQCFEPSLLKGALTKVLKLNLTVTDDCQAVERLGMPIAMTTGDPTNIKITEPSDLLLAQAILTQRNQSPYRKH